MTNRYDPDPGVAAAHSRIAARQRAAEEAEAAEVAARNAYYAQIAAEQEKKRAKAFGDALAEINRVYAMVALGGSIRIMKETTDQDGAPRPRFMRVDDFRLELANRTIQNDGKCAPLADVWLHHAQRRSYSDVLFAPGRDVPGCYNLWRGFAVTPRAGDCSLYKRHLREHVCGGDARLATWLWAWLAQIIQRPGQPIGVAVVLRGRQGAGKSIVGELFGDLLRPHYVPADQPSHVVGRFNSHLEKCLLLQVDDVTLTRPDVLGALKGLVTGSRQLIERKGVDLHEARNYVRVLITSDQDWVVPAGLDERRFAVFAVTDGGAREPGLFAAMRAEMDNGGREALMFELLSADISGIDLRRPPATAALVGQKIESLRPELRWWFEALYRGSQLRGGAWEPCVARDAIHEDYAASCDLVGIRQRAWQTALGALIKRVYPDLRSRQQLVTVGHDVARRPIKRQVRCYLFGPLPAARAAFDAALGQPVDWPADSDDTPSGAE